MKILVVADGHYYKVRNKDIYYVDSVFDYNFYKRYIPVFEEVYAIVRVKVVDEIPSYAKIASGEHVTFLPIEDTVGAKEYFLRYSSTKRKIKEYIKDFDKAIFRVPGVTANEVYKFWNKKKPYALEVVVDPWEYFAPGTIKGFVRPLVRLWWTLLLKRMCMNSIAVSYVTEHYLQKRYPCKAMKGSEGYITSHYSSVELPDDEFQTPRTYEKKDLYVISHVAASFATYGKGHMTLMKALRIILDKGYNVKVVFVGDGPLIDEFKNFAKELDVENNVVFTGLLPSGDAVRETMRKSDIFVFPTKAEGLPRVVLEAMAEGLPVISSPVCGIPGIVQKENLIDYNDYKKYAERIIELINNPNEMMSLSCKNLITAKMFKRSILQQRRECFFDAVKRMLKIA